MATATSLPRPEAAHTDPTRQLLDHIALPEASRGLCVGMTGCGKSTLAEKLIAHWLDTYGAKARVLIIDSKPRFRAEKRLDDWSARSYYKNWKYGAPMPGSVRLDLKHTDGELRAAFRRGYRVAIAQGDLSSLPWLRFAVDRFYAQGNAKYQQLLYVDELADFYSSSGLTSLGDPTLKVIRSGREKGVAFLGSTQRPKGIPKSVLTELTNMYFFRTAFRQDVEHLQEMGFPDRVDHDLLYRHRHSFYFFSHEHPERAGYYRLAKEVAA